MDNFLANLGTNLLSDLIFGSLVVGAWRRLYEPWRQAKTIYCYLDHRMGGGNPIWLQIRNGSAERITRLCYGMASQAYDNQTNSFPSWFMEAGRQEPIQYLDPQKMVEVQVGGRRQAFTIFVTWFDGKSYWVRDLLNDRSGGEGTHLRRISKRKWAKNGGNPGAPFIGAQSFAVPIPGPAQGQ